MAIIANNKGGAGYTPAPPGTHAAICCDVVDNGVLEVTYSKKTTKQHKVTLVWQIAENQEDGKPFRVQKRYTLSLHDKATLTKDLEAWRGRAFSDDEKAGFDVESLIAIPALLNVIHAAGRDGSIWANIASLMRLPTQMEAPKIRDYVRVCNREPTQAQPVGGDHDEDYIPRDEDVPF